MAALSSTTPTPPGVAAGCCLFCCLCSVTFLNYSCHNRPFVVCNTQVCSLETQMGISELAFHDPKDSHGHVLGRGSEEAEAAHMADGDVKCRSHGRKRSGSSSQREREKRPMTQHLHSGYLPKMTENTDPHKNPHENTQSTTTHHSPNRKQPKRLSADERTNKMWSIHPAGY